MKMKGNRGITARAGGAFAAVLLAAVMAGCATREFTVDTARAAAARGDARAQCFLARCYTRGQGVPQDYARAAGYFRQAASQGCATAQSDLGAFYAEGWGVPQDYTEAIKWFRLAAEQGDPLAQYSMGMSYELGRGVATNLTEGIRWYERAAARGVVEAQLELGNLHLGGRGVPVDYRIAQKWYRKAAAQHSATAVNALGYICEEGGFGVPKDLTKAAAYYRQAARAGDGKAQANLGRAYLEGLSVPKDPVEAYKWFSLASTNGGASAGHYMDELAGIARYGDYAGPSLTADQMKEALRRAAEFQACPWNQKP